MKKNELKYKLLENGIDSIIHGIEHFLDAEKESRNLKYAILHVFHGLELILKEKLYQINPILIYLKIDEPIHDKANTVMFNNITTRLTNAGVDLSEEDCVRIKCIQQIRNQIEHKDIAVSISKAKDIIGGSLEFIVKFMQEELGEELRTHLNNDDKYEALLDLIGYHEEKLKLAKEKITEYYLGMSSKTKSENPLETCPVCFNDTVIMDEAEKTATCYYCNNELHVNRCLRCGATILDEAGYEDEQICDSCDSYIASQ